MNKKTIFIIGAIGTLLGVVFLVLKMKLIGWGLIILSVVFEIIGFIAAALVGASKAATDNSEENFEVRLNNALSKVRQDKFKAESDIRRIKGWANDAILTAYQEFFPSGELMMQKDNLLLKYAELKAEYEPKLSFETSEKCHKVVTGYINQIGLKESQIQLLEKLQEEYSDTKKKYDIAKNKSKRNDRLDMHDKRLQELENNTDSIANTMMHQYKLEDVKKEFIVKEAYIDQLEKLQYQYGDESNMNNAVAYKQQIDKMLTEMKR